MSKTEYIQPKLLPGEMDRPDIGIEAEKILGLLLRADPMMNATNRRRYNDRAIGAIQDVIRAFVLAHDFENERYRYLKEMWGHIAVFIRIMRCIGEVNAIELQPKHEPMSPNLMKLELMNHMARMEEGALKWKRSIEKQIYGTRARPQSRDGGSHPENKGDPTP